jgi:predicted metal-dependent HD superfamily phosphohydrolase
MKEVAEFYHHTRHQLSVEIQDRWTSIERAYRSRPYHNLKHLAEMIGHLRAAPELPAPAASPLFGMALIYHDYVYRPTRGNNEAQSAEVCGQHLSEDGLPAEQLHRCRELIMATKTHQPSSGDDGAEAWLIDVDLAVLARPTAEYRQYLEGIRREFWMYPGFLYRPGRRKVLQYFLGMEYIFHTPYGRQHFEKGARENLVNELQQLGG